MKMPESTLMTLKIHRDLLILEQIHSKGEYSSSFVLLFVPVTFSKTVHSESYLSIFLRAALQVSKRMCLFHA